MIQQYDKKLSIKLISDRLFCMVFGTLRDLHPSQTQLNPVEVWMAARAFTEQMNECEEAGELVDYFLEELREECSKVSGSKVSGGTDNGTLELLNSGTFATILIVSICQLSAIRTEKAVANIKLLLPYCQEHPLFDTMLMKIGAKEQEMAMVGKKVEIMDYTFMELKQEPQSVGKMTELLDLALSMPGGDFTSTLLAFSIFNIQNGNAFNQVVLDYYNRMVEKNAPKPGIEVTLGNKNVAQNGGVQVNTDPTQTSPNQMLEMFNQLKRLK